MAVSTVRESPFGVGEVWLPLMKEVWLPRSPLRGNVRFDLL